MNVEKSKKEYVLDFLARIGFKDNGLSDKTIEFIFSYLAGIEELKTNRKYNDHNWEMNYASFDIKKNRYIPVIDYKIFNLYHKGLLKKIDRKENMWPQKKKFALCITHDIDHLFGKSFLYYRKMIPHFNKAPIKNKLLFLGSFIKNSLNIKKKSIPDLGIWLKAEEKHNFKSSFLFFSDKLIEPSWEDSFYKYTDKTIFEGQKVEIGCVIKEIFKRGWDVGLHGSCKSYCNSQYLKYEKKRLENLIDCEIKTIRQHHLMFDIRDTPQCQNAVNFKVDSTRGSNISPDFRCGTGFPFYQYDLNNEKSLDILQIPLVIQDNALFRHEKLNKEQVVNYVSEVMEMVADINGCMTILWHNNYYKNDKEFQAFEEILNKADKLGAWGCSLRELNDWWRRKRN
ncbi:polysaccharide deacetylase family protein [Acetohalobium arabaticum]|uniref:NodB homology domain-containing protein n=1 Tax=Acetohalobium arabaticum (strain ATCC 49924 / DSM 5501 / Z-7288) TaxID=574087 RepID=D9QTB1_ACEAZ|nr:polysaccharide deacetylase family protein [Acetohalobium arabaticum]ADL13611.1 conserved hypothetical protein [Acetohalobium arabaticum DSM 5501]